jgi:hypothetical protein
VFYGAVIFCLPQNEEKKKFTQRLQQHSWKSFGKNNNVVIKASVFQHDPETK